MPPTATASVPTSSGREGPANMKSRGKNWPGPSPRKGPAAWREASATTRNITGSGKSGPGPRPPRPCGYSSAYTPPTPLRSAGECGGNGC